jgi:hypothetical protein
MEAPDGQTRNHVGGGRIGFGIGRMVGQRADARRFERAEREGTKRNHHPQDGLRRLWPLVPAWHAPGLRAGSLLVRSLLVSG